MSVPVPRRLRSVLIAPGSRPDVLEKLPRSGPDGVMIDLEDAVPPAAKPDARGHARRAGEQLATHYPDLAVYVRVNAVDTEWFSEDVTSLFGGLAGVVVPKLESSAQVRVVADALARAGLDRLHVLAGLETAAAIEHAPEVLVPPVAVAYFGAEDFAADMGGVRTPDNLEVLYARSRVVLAARLAGVAALDQIVAALDDEGRFVADAEQGRALGYAGKLCIHPGQVGLANRAFSPAPEEVERARRLLSVYEEATARGEAAVAFEGQMVDEPMARQARALLVAADAEHAAGA